MIKFTILLSLLFFFSGCSQKIIIESIQPAQIDDKDIKKVTVTKFNNDSIALSSNIKAQLNSVSLNNKKYFTLVNREVGFIEKEQKLQDSGLVNISQEKVFELGEVNSVITGKINSKNYNRNIFYQTRTNYNKCHKYETNKKGEKICTKYREYLVRCIHHKYSIDAFISIIRVSNNEIIFANNYSEKISIDKCSNDTNLIPSKQSVFHEISKSISADFVNILKPNYKYFEVYLKDDSDIEYSDLEERLLENALQLVELNLIVEANNIFKSLVISTKEKSITALYNYGVTNEYLGNLEKAYTLYKNAETLSLQNKIDKDIFNALIRLEKSIKNKEKAYQQINY